MLVIYRNIFSQCDLICPELDFALCLAWALYLYGTFAIHSEELWKSLGSRLPLGSSRQTRGSIKRRTRRTLTFGITLTDIWRFQEILRLPYNPLAESSRSPPRAFRFVYSFGSQAGEYATPNEWKVAGDSDIFVILVNQAQHCEENLIMMILVRKNNLRRFQYWIRHQNRLEFFCSTHHLKVRGCTELVDIRQSANMYTGIWPPSVQLLGDGHLNGLLNEPPRPITTFCPSVSDSRRHWWALTAWIRAAWMRMFWAFWAEPESRQADCALRSIFRIIPL